jgi:parallel beta-helix repeat protein
VPRGAAWTAVLVLLVSLGAGTAVTIRPTAQGDALAVGEHREVCRTDTDGRCWVRHTLGVVPTDLQVTVRLWRNERPYTVSLVPGSAAVDRFQVQATRSDGRPKANSNIRFSWTAAQPAAGVPQPSTTTTTAPTATTTSATTTAAPTTTTTTSQAPAAGSPAAVCGTAALTGPSSPPAGAVVVQAGDNSGVDFEQPNTTYWFAPGVHTLGSGQFSQIIPADGSTFVGAPGAVVDGQRVNRYAFTQHARNVTIRYLTIRNFVSPNDEGVVNHDSGNNWLIEHNTMINNEGAAMMAGAGQRVIGNCLKDNGQYGMNAFQAGNGITGLVLDGNEFVGNNTGDWETKNPGCGCTGGMKFWAVNGATVRNNWIHHNHGPGVWADTNNNDFLIENNLIEGNEGMGIFYEISYNVMIRGNTMRNNAWKTGREFANRGDTFPIGAIYLSEAGGEPRLPARTTAVEITGNVFENNWGGVVGWENADRFCNSPASTTNDCTLIVGPQNTSRCAQPAISSEPLRSDCRWKTQRLNIHHNRFVFDPAKVDGGCPTAYCGRSALFANYGTYPDWSPYKARTVQEAITFGQGNHWHDNTYTGPWLFVPYETTRDLSLAQWQATPYGQDLGSTS